MDSAEDTPRGVGCPIRRPWDQRSLASPPGFSQRATSFIASQCQGIHQMPFISLHTAPNNKDPVLRRQDTGSRNQEGTIAGHGNHVPGLDPGDRSPEDTSGRRTEPGLQGITLHPRPRRLPPRSRTTRLFTLSINKPAAAHRADANDFFLPSSHTETATRLSPNWWR